MYFFSFLQAHFITLFFHIVEFFLFHELWVFFFLSQTYFLSFFSSFYNFFLSFYEHALLCMSLIVKDFLIHALLLKLYSSSCTLPTIKKHSKWWKTYITMEINDYGLGVGDSRWKFSMDGALVGFGLVVLIQDYLNNFINSQITTFA